MTVNPLNPAMDIAPLAPQEASSRRELQRKGIKRLGLTLIPYGVAIVWLILSAVLGRAEWWQVMLYTGLVSLGLSTFYLLLRSGLAARFADPMLIFPQVLFTIGMVSLSYALIDSARALVLQWLCLIIVFDMRRLGLKQTSIAAAVAMTLPAVGVYLVWLLRPDTINPQTQFVYLTMGLVLVTVLLLVSAAARMVGRRGKRQRQEMAHALAQLRQLSIHDSLTGLYNRSHMQSLLEEELRRYQRTGRTFCLAIVDIDFFKRINDQFGHAVGDAVLREFSTLGRAALERDSDSLARWGGEEFLLLMPETEQGLAHATLSRMRALVTGHDWTRLHAQLHVDFSAGVCEHREGASLAQTMEAADQALYRAKAQGRGRVETTKPLTEAEHAASAAASVTASVTDKAAALKIPNLTGAALSDVPVGDYSDAAGSPAARPAKQARPEAQWKTWLLGSDPAIREALPMCLVAMCQYFVIMAFTILYGIPSGIYSREAAMIVLLMDCIGAFVPYVLIRGGFTVHLKDRSLVMPQMIWALLALTFCNIFVPDIRPYAQALMAAVLVFGFVNLIPAQAVAVGLSAVSMLALTYLVLFVTRPAKFDPAYEAVTVVVNVCIFVLLTMQSRNLALKRERVRQERREVVATIEQVSHLMRRDTLTGLYNRQYMQDLLERECERHELSGFGLCAALIDLDHFKKINDEYGHHVGDEALVGFARSAQESLRDTDVIGRWGGEEFLLVLVDTEPGGQGALAVERLREHLATQRASPGAPELAVTFSAGLALRKPGETPAQLLERADRALYAAKAQGRNRSIQAAA